MMIRLSVFLGMNAFKTIFLSSIVAFILSLCVFHIGILLAILASIAAPLVVAILIIALFRHDMKSIAHGHSLSLD